MIGGAAQARDGEREAARGAGQSTRRLPRRSAALFLFLHLLFIHLFVE